MRRPARTAGVLLLLVLMIGCQLPTATYFKDEVFPQDDATKAFSFPLLFPFYVVLTAIDLMLVNPARGTMNVSEITYGVWAWHNERNPWIGYGVLMPFKLVGIPAAAVGTILFSEQFETKAGSGERPPAPNMR